MGRHHPLQRQDRLPGAARRYRVSPGGLRPEGSPRPGMGGVRRPDPGNLGGGDRRGPGGRPVSGRLRAHRDRPRDPGPLARLSHLAQGARDPVPLRAPASLAPEPEAGRHRPGPPRGDPGGSRLLRPARLHPCGHSDSHRVHRGGGRRAVRHRLLRPGQGLPGPDRPALRGGRGGGAGQDLLLRPHLPGREIEDPAPPDRVLDGRARSGLQRLRRQHAAPGRLRELPGGPGPGTRRRAAQGAGARHRATGEGGAPVSPDQLHRRGDPAQPARERHHLGTGPRRRRRDPPLQGLGYSDLRDELSQGGEGLLHEGESPGSANHSRQRLPGSGRLRGDHRRLPARGRPRQAAGPDQGAGPRPRVISLVPGPPEIRDFRALGLRAGARAHGGVDLRHSPYPGGDRVSEADSSAVSVRKPAIRYPLSAIGQAVGLFLAAGSAGAQPPLPGIELRPGLVITQSGRIKPGIYHFPAPTSTDSSLITVRGDDIELDFTGVTIQGTRVSADPDQGQGVAIRIEGGKNIEIRNARIRGFKIGILARDVRGLRLIGNDASHNWKPRLYSLIEHESLVDWLSYHQNDKDEWYRYGAGFYLSGVQGGEVRENTVEQGMNGLLMTRSDSLRIVGNNFSFNSGLGIGLYRSSDNLIASNRLRFNVRGYSHGFYRRGQDSAALLIYEQSNRNIVAWNAATHSGDGLFLWAGQTTMDSGAGGANDNVFYANDFSWAPTNAMEATFSRNSFLANRAVGSEYGLWGGYSFESKVIGNCFGKNRFGIAIEHGQDNRIASNVFDGDSLAIRLWADSIQPSDWGYPKHRDTRSRDYRIEGNFFLGNRLTVRAANTSGLAEQGNLAAAPPSGCVIGRLPEAHAALGPALPGVDPRVPSSRFADRDRSAMVVDEWGPYDWKSPKLWPLDSSRAVPLRLAMLGPEGRWREVGRRGVASLSSSSGSVGDTIAVTPSAGALGDWSVELEYRGSGTHRFGYARFEPAQRWETVFFTWADTTALAGGPEAFSRLARAAPLMRRTLSRLDYQWYRPRIPELPIEKWGLEAGTAVDLPPGRYRLRTISDDGIRVWVDGKLVIERWSTHESTVDEAPLTGGRHDLRVQYYQNGGWTELRVEIVRSPVQSRG